MSVWSRSWAYGRVFRMASCARRSFAADTIFMAFVICRVDLTEPMRLRMSRREGTGVPSRRALKPALGLEHAAELACSAASSELADAVVERLLLARASSRPPGGGRRGTRGAPSCSGRPRSVGTGADPALAVLVLLRRGVELDDLLLDRSSGEYWPCFSTSTSRSPRASVSCVALSRSEPNCANAASSRYCARSSLSEPATCFIALICAEPPTRETEMPTLIAGRTPW